MSKRSDIGDAQPFNGATYLSKYPDVRMLGMDPLDHFTRIGRFIGRNDTLLDEGARGAGDAHVDAPVPFAGFGTIRHDPLISILIVSYNSAGDLETLFRSLSEQTYRKFEIVLVENGTQDTQSVLKRYFPDGKFVRKDNVGFAEGNNVALELSTGELVALINPDTRLACDMLQKMLEALRFDEKAAIVVPKINFFERYVRLRIKADGPFAIARTDLVKGLAYTKLFMQDGIADKEVLQSDSTGLLNVLLPYERPRQIKLELQSEHRLGRCDVQIDFSQVQRHRQPSANTLSLAIDFSAENCANARYLVNNAGSALHSDGSPYDRGFGQFDEGAFYTKAYVDALCGCAALIRRSAILGRNLFIGPMFAYYEDSELSHWIRSQNYRILYQPEARIYHRHSESTSEHSLTWTVLVNRSRRIYDRVTRNRRGRLADFSFEYPDNFTGPLRDKLEALDGVIRKAGDAMSICAAKRPIACVYNSYFNSMGGGEKHSLDIAELLRETYDVYLVSENDFSISEMEEYFSLDLAGVRKIICNNVDTAFTAKFDLFVNSTFLSRIRSAAKDSLYVVSFPEYGLSTAVVRNYHFVHNSPFTARWATEYWGPHRSTIVLPILGRYGSGEAMSANPKQKVLLSVGRFNYDGHCKNHHLIAKAFRCLVDEGRISANWCLMILGSCDLSVAGANRYLEDLTLLAQGYNILVKPNASRADLDEAYRTAAIYVHAAGLGVLPSRPERHEHFGITPFEAMANACIPVVYHLGGPAEQVAGLRQGETYRDEAGLQQAILDAIERFGSDPAVGSAIKQHAGRMKADNAQVALKLFASQQSMQGQQGRPKGDLLVP